MINYILPRLLWLPFLLLVVSFVTFCLGFFGPGDPAIVRLGSKATPEKVALLNEKLGLDKPLIVQYTAYMGRFIQGDLGDSYIFEHRSVGELIAPKLLISAQLGLAALTIAFVVGIPVGLLAAYRQGSWIDTALVSLTLLFYSTPVFISAPFLIMLFAVKLHMLPASGWDGFLSLSILMPAFVMGIPGIASITRLTRSSCLEAISQDYVRTARAKGLSEIAVGFHHVLRNALTPILTVFGLSLATLVEGAFITETIFGIPGIGRFAVDSIFNRDYPVIVAMVIIVAMGFALSNLMIDLFYGVLDPRVRKRGIS